VKCNFICISHKSIDLKEKSTMNTHHSRFTFHLLILFALLTSLLGSAVFVTPVRASTLIVTNTNDSGAGSLRVTLNGATVGDTITFDALLSGGTIYLASSLTLPQNITIDGSDLTAQITISGDSDNNGTGDVQVFQVNGGVTATLNSLIITKGLLTSNGGGINNDGTLTVTNSTVAGNSVTSGNAGGIYNAGTLNIMNSTISGNSASGSGGGIYNAGTLNITNSTISGNSATYGGGIHTAISSLTSITNSTVSANVGNGIFNYGTLNYANTIIANSTAGIDCVSAGTLGTNINNLVEDGTCAGSLAGDPNLGTLADNGGPTRTLALLPGSPAIDAGDDTVCAAAPVNNLDQRGVTRPEGTNCDIGSFEYEKMPIIVTTNADPGDGTCDATCSLRAAIIAANADGGADIIHFDNDYTITLASPMPNISESLTIDGETNSIVIDGDDDYLTEVYLGVTASLANLTIQNSNGTNGGVILNRGILSITNTTFRENTANAGSGGALYNYQGILNITNSTFTNNSAVSGGAIKNDAGTLNITNSTFSGNTAPGGSGGAIINFTGVTNLKNSTFSGNSSSNGSIYLFTGTLNYANTIIANSTGGDCVNAGTLGTNTNNLVEDGSCSASLSGDPNLGALANNGGATQTLALIAGSTAINAGDDSICAASPVSNLDQRGITRPNGLHCDIGAYEYVDTIAPTVVSSTRVSSNPSSLTSVEFTVAFSEAVTGVDTSDFDLTISGVSGASMTGITGSGSTYTVTVNTGSGNGSIRLNVLDDNTILDGSNNPLNGAYSSGETYTIDKTVTLTINSMALNDGWVLESTETSEVGGTLDSTATNFNLGDNAANKQYRVILHFDTSALPDTAIITSATLKIKRQGVMGSNPFNILGDLKASVRKPAFGAATLALSDFKTTAGKNNVATFGTTPVSNWYSALLNNAGKLYVNRTGTTQFRLSFTTDDNNDFGADLMKFFSGNAGAANRPQFIIQYYVP
jgi:CSLREA domain-containing protein